MVFFRVLENRSLTFVLAKLSLAAALVMATTPWTSLIRVQLLIAERAGPLEQLLGWEG